MADMKSGASKQPPSNNSAAAYRVLARKYRPTTFDELIGQEAMVRTLTNAIAADRLPHAWMLTGVRGIGKTTTARIIARSLNCVGADGKGSATVNPCGVCDSCKAISEDRHVDVLEMDAASRTGVDDIRDIIDGVRYGPVSARYKIYILDEVHMLSKNAFNALLKTLEEPPPHTKFIFATTEIRRVPVTVLSRCQRFDLRRIDSAMLFSHFTGIMEKEGIKAEAEAIKLIAHAADGSVRDGLSLLDQAVAKGDGTVTASDVKDMLGLADRAHSLALGRQLFRGETAAALKTFASMQQTGADPLQTLQDLCEIVHLLTRAQIIPDFASSPDIPEMDRQLLVDLADIKVAALSRSWQILMKGVAEVQEAPYPAQAAEMVLIRMAYAAELPPPGDLIKQLREQLGSSGAAASPSPTSGGGGGGSKAMLVRSGAVAAHRKIEMAEPAAAIIQPGVSQPGTFREIVALFDEKREGALCAQLRSAVHPVRCEPGLLEVSLNSGLSPDFISRIGQCLNKWTERRWMISVTDAPGAPTLADEEKEAENKRHERIDAHPLMRSVLLAFPGAKMTALRQKVTPIKVEEDEVSTDIAELLTEFED